MKLLFLFILAVSVEGVSKGSLSMAKIRCPLKLAKGSPLRLVGTNSDSAMVKVLLASGANPADPADHGVSAVSDAVLILKEGHDKLLENFDALPLLNRAILLARMDLSPDHLHSGIAQGLVAKKVQALKSSLSSASTERLMYEAYIASSDFERYLPSVSRLSVADMRQSWDELAGNSKTRAYEMHVQDRKTGKSATMPVIVDEDDPPLLAIDVLKRLARLFLHTNRRDLLEHLNQLDWDETRELVRKITQKDYLKLFNEGNPRLVKRLDGKIAQSSLDIVFNNYLRFDALRLAVIGSPKHHGYDPKELARANRLRKSVAEMQEIDAMPYSRERGEAMAEKLAEVSNSEYYSFPPQRKISDLESSKLGKALLQDLTPSTINALFTISPPKTSATYDLSQVEKRLARLNMIAEELQALSALNPIED